MFPKFKNVLQFPGLQYSDVGHIRKYDTFHVISTASCWGFYIPEMLTTDENMPIFAWYVIVCCCWFYIPAILATSENANFRVVCYCLLLKVLYSCDTGNIWEYPNFRVVCYCLLLKVLYSCDAGNIWEYANFPVVCYCLLLKVLYSWQHLRISPFSCNTCTESTFLLWCWPYLKICRFSCDMSTADSSIFLWCCHISRYAPFHVIWPLHKIIPVILAKPHRYAAFHAIWPQHKVIPVMLATYENMPISLWYVIVRCWGYYCIFLRCWQHLRICQFSWITWT